MGSEHAPVIPQVGIGTDIHAFEEGRELWCAGLLWEGEGPGLAGHSDADVVAHAACNALFSAAGLGDLGAALRHRAARVVRRVRASPCWPRRPGSSGPTGFAIGNVAVQVVGVRPKIGKRRDEAQKVLSDGGRRARLGLRRHHGRAGLHRPRRGPGGDRHGPGRPDGLTASVRRRAGLAPAG